MSETKLPLHAAFIDGEMVDGSALPTLDLVTPHDGKVIGRIAESGAHVVDRAVQAAASAFAAHRKQPVYQRIAWLKAA
ncbi:MAG TPA: aldehyde dehydrogenase family protein, partial [Hyphomicrobiaceae bacterium]|nr:aldehyde dehydrogenase family protein [Hyphomicrobiaceae bacterium]